MSQKAPAFPTSFGNVWFGLVAGLLIFTIGSVLLTKAASRWWFIHRSKNWPLAAATVLAQQYQSGAFGVGSTTVHFKFTAADQKEYESRASLSGAHTGLNAIEVFYDPSNPNRNVSNPEEQLADCSLAAMLGILLINLGAGLALKFTGTIIRRRIEIAMLRESPG